MKSSARTRNEEIKEPERSAAFAERLRSALLGKNQSHIAKAVGIAGSTLHRYLGGSMPAADTAFKLARELGVRPEWLIEGQGQVVADAEVVGLQGPVTLLSKYDLFAFSEDGKPLANETVALPNTWLLGAVRTTSGLWIAEMPSDAMPSLAREGDLLICRDAEERLQDRRIYVFLIDGRPIVRKVFVRPDGLQLRSEDDSDTMLITPHELEALTPIARVVSAISIHAA